MPVGVVARAVTRAQAVAGVLEVELFQQPELAVAAAVAVAAAPQQEVVLAGVVLVHTAPVPTELRAQFIPAAVVVLAACPAAPQPLIAVATGGRLAAVVGALLVA
jgi:uncharacterized membrane protein YgaE (UPF0421/DUF939 family)